MEQKEIHASLLELKHQKEILSKLKEEFYELESMRLKERPVLDSESATLTKVLEVLKLICELQDLTYVLTVNAEAFVNDVIQKLEEDEKKIVEALK